MSTTDAADANALGVLRSGIDDGAMPGVVVCALRGGEVLFEAALGTLDGERPVSADTLYDLASITKPLATAASLVTLLERGRITLTATLPSLLGPAASHLASVTVGHLLTHTSGLPAWTPCYDNGRGLDAAVDAILRLPLGAQPGTRYEYSCLGFILLGKIIETVTETTLDGFARESVHAPLGLGSLTYRPEPSSPNIAPTRSAEGPDRENALIGIVHDGNARGIGGVSGNAGLFGTARDVAAFGEAVWTGRVFGAPATRRALESQIKPEIGGHTLLFFAQPNGLTPVGDLLSPRAVGHSGYTGTLLAIDPEFDLVAAVLTNSVYIDGKSNWLTVRRRFMNALGALI